MAAKAEVLSAPTARIHTRKDASIARSVGKALSNWSRRGRLGTSYTTDMGRYTGGRI